MAENDLIFKVSDVCGTRKNTVYLVNDKWDDWFTYETQYVAYYVDNEGTNKRIGFVKIAEMNQSERRAKLPEMFQSLDENFISLGASEDYYISLKDNLSEYREKILVALNDIAYNLSLFEHVKNQPVVNQSLMRDLTRSMVKGQFNRMAKGGARLTNYSFTYCMSKDSGGESNKISFEVLAESKPPTNIHAIIGKNGVGKTTLLKKCCFRYLIDSIMHSTADMKV